MSKLKKALRAVGAKVKKSTPRVQANPQEALNASMGMFLNAQGAFLASEIAKAREEGVKLGAGIDAAESLRLLAVENAKLRGFVERFCEEMGADDTEIGQEAAEFLKRPPQRFELKADASVPGQSTDSTPAAEPQAPESEPHAPALPDAPPAGAQPDEAAPLPH